MHILAARTADFLVTCGAIKQKDISIYRYGLEVLYLSVLEILSILLLAAWVGNFFETLLYFAAFIPLRLFAGGYHANTRLGCYFASLCVYGVFSMVVAFATISYLWSVLLAIIALIIICRYAPVVHKNHKISNEEFTRVRTMGRKLAMMELLIIVVIGMVSIQLALVITLGFVFEALSIIVVFFDNIQCKKWHQILLKEKDWFKFIIYRGAIILSYCAILFSGIIKSTVSTTIFYEPEQPEELKRLKIKY